MTQLQPEIASIERHRSEPIDDDACRVFQAAVELAGKKWSAAILLALARGASRFSTIRESVDGLSDRLLTARLRELELHALVEREVVPTFPVQIRYRLTQSGFELIETLRPLVAWAGRWNQQPAEADTHEGHDGERTTALDGTWTQAGS